MLRTLVALTISLTGCATYRPSFTCAVPAVAHAWPVIPQTSQAPGRFELKSLDGPEAKLERRVQVIADAIPISTFVAKLGEAFGQSMSVSQDVMDARVSVVGTLTLQQLLDVLKTSHVRTRGAEVMEFITEQEVMRRREVWFDATPFSIQIIDLHRAELAHQFAAMACATVISPGGSVAVVGQKIVVRDRGESLGKLRAAVQALLEN
jgi:hypothetical protein